MNKKKEQWRIIINRMKAEEMLKYRTKYFKGNRYQKTQRKWIKKSPKSSRNNEIRDY